jgi:hypothetical protein
MLVAAFGAMKRSTPDVTLARRTLEEADRLDPSGSVSLPECAYRHYIDHVVFVTIAVALPKHQRDPTLLRRLVQRRDWTREFDVCMLLERLFYHEDPLQEGGRVRYERQQQPPPSAESLAWFADLLGILSLSPVFWRIIRKAAYFAANERLHAVMQIVTRTARQSGMLSAVQSGRRLARRRLQ